MKHLKLYEQFDFEDLSEEDLFGQNKWTLTEFLELDGTVTYYIIQEYIDDNTVVLYNDFYFSRYVDRRFKKISVIDKNSEISVYDENMIYKKRRVPISFSFASVKFEDLADDVKKRLDIKVI